MPFQSINRAHRRGPTVLRALGGMAVLIPVIVVSILFLPATVAAQTSLACGSVLQIGDATQSCLRVVNADPTGKRHRSLSRRAESLRTSISAKPRTLWRCPATHSASVWSRQAARWINPRST